METFTIRCIRYICICISESLETIFWAKILKFFDADADPAPGSGNRFDPGSGMEKIRIRAGSATLMAEVP
jgi:hypothetical protein